MANRKVFTDFQFEGGAQLKFPIAHSDVTEPASKGPGQLWFNSAVGGDPEVGLGTLSVQYAAMSGTSDFRALLTAGVPFTTGSLVTFNNNPPFAVGNSTVVANLNAAQVAGKVPSTTAVDGTIPLYTGTNLLVGTPTADGHATPRSYVDNAIQGLDHKESVVVATTVNIATATALNNADTLDGITLQDGDRVLVKNQATSSENGIYIVGATPVLANDSNLGSELIENGTFTGTSGAPSGWTAPGGATLTLNANRMKVLGGYALDSFTTIVGKTYRLQFDLTIEVTNGSYRGGFYLGSSANTYDIMTSGALSSSLTAATYYFIAKSTTTYLSLYAWDGGSEFVYYDNVSVKEDNLTEGAYVFVEKGTANENSSWVLSAKATETSASGNAWTQFSGAGQISVSNVTAATTPAHTTPLFKQGDTISFGYNGGHFGIDGNGNLKIADDGLGAGQIATSAIGALELDNSASFTMAGLTATTGTFTGNVSIANTTAAPTNQESVPPVLTFDGYGWDSNSGSDPIQGRIELLANYGDYGSGATQPVLAFSVKGAGGLGSESEILKEGLRILADGKVGIGADPSGTLHVSSGRYGSNVLSSANTNWGTDVANLSAFNAAYDWTGHVATALTVSSNVLQFSTAGAYRGMYYNASFVAGRRYRVVLQTGTITGSTFKAYTYATGYTEIGTLVASTTNTFDFTAEASLNGYLYVYATTGDAATIQFNAASVTNELKEDYFGNVTPNHWADEFVVQGTEAKGSGLTILSQYDQGGHIFFGKDGASDANRRGKINYYHSEHATTSLRDKMVFATAGTDALEIDSSQNVKIPNGGLGVGTDETTAGALTTTGAITAGGALAGTTGAFSGEVDLTLGLDWHDPTSTVFGRLGYGAGFVYVGALGATGILQLMSGGNLACTFAANHDATFTGALTTSGALTTGGILDHGGFPTVNSSTVQGLQDGACYDFDGSSGYVSAGGVDFSTSDFTYGCWVKFDSFVAYSGIVCNRSSTTPNTGTELRIGASSTNLELFTDFGSTTMTSSVAVSTLSTGRWYHVVAVLDRSDKQYLYIDGVLMDSDSISSQSSTSITNGDDLLIGKASAYHNGQIRDVKIIPSALTAPDVRKLYSGENPKKNLNVELAVDGTFSDTANWGEQTGWAVTGGKAVATAAGNAAQLWQDRTYTVGKFYRTVFEISGYSAGGVTANFGGAVSETFAANGTHTFVFKATAASSYINLVTVGTTTLNIEYVTLTEVATLVDFNPRSASTTKWYNQAIPSLYNGSLEGGVTLSAGSTDHRVDGAVAVDGNMDVEGSLYVGADSATTVYSYMNSTTRNKLIVPTNASIELTTNTIKRLEVIGGATAGVFIADKLGVGLVPIHPFMAQVSDGVNFSLTLNTISSVNRVRLNGINNNSSANVGMEFAASDFRFFTGAVTMDETLTVSRTTNGGRSIRINPTVLNESRVEFQEGGITQWSAGNWGTEHSFIIGTGGNLATAKLVIEKQGSIRAAAKVGETVLLIHSDAEDAGITFFDSSFHRYVITRGGHTHHSDDQVKFGATSLYFDGNGDYLSIPFSSYWNFSNNDFTLETWIRPTSMTDHAGNAGTILSQDDNSSNKGWDLRLNSNGTLLFRHSTTGGNEVDTTSSATGIAINNWYHVAFVRSSDAYAFYVNGVQKGTGSLTNTIYNSTYAVLVGARGPSSGGGNLFFTGYMDEVRISKGVARWTSSFTPPSSPYSTVNAEFFNEYDKIATLGFGTPLLRVGALDGVWYSLSLNSGLNGNSVISLTGSGSAGLNTWAGATTIAMWIKPNGVPYEWDGLYSDANSSISGTALCFGASGLLRLASDSGSPAANSTTAVTANEWNHVVVSYDGTTATFYINGVNAGGGAFSQDAVGTVDFAIGQYYGGTGNANQYKFDGYIRQLQHFPSALNSGEVAQLYNGYNPKKNLQVELITNGTFTGDGAATGWTAQRSAVVTQIGGQLKVLNDGNVGSGMAEQARTVVANKHYRLKVDVKEINGAAAAYVRIWTGSATSGTQLLNHAPNAAADELTYVFNSSTFTTVYVVLQVYGGDDDDFVKFDNVSLEEVGTLVDFNSRSASPATWHNSAIPTLYNGTVNGASMSAGSTDRYAAGDFRAAADVQVDGALDVDGDTKVNGKLGVGGDPGTEQLTVVGNIEMTGGLSKIINASGGLEIHAANVLVQEMWTSGSDYHFKSFHNFVKFPSANVMIGVDASATTALEVKSASGTPEVLTLRDGTGLSADNGAAILLNGINHSGGSQHVSYAKIKAGKLNASQNSTHGYLSFYSNDSSSSALTERLRLQADGDHNHYANRIVNSQTVNDLHRTAEPSLRFDGATASTPNTSDDYVDTGNTFDSTFSRSFTISAWVRLKDGQSSIQTIVGQSTASQYDHVQLSVNANGTITGQYYLHPNSAAVTSTVALPDGDTGWRHIVWTVKDEDAADTSILYLDGVNIKSAQNNAGGSMSGFGDGSDNLWIGAYNRNGGGYSFLGGEIKDVRIHNRALDADAGEIAALYNGESTPWKYADAGAELLTDGAFENWDSSSLLTSWGEYNESSSAVAQSTDEYAGTYALSFVVNASNSSVGVFQSGTVVGGKSYRVTFWAKANSGTPSLGVRTAPNSGNGVSSNTIHQTHTLTTSYAQYTTDFTAPAGDGNLILFRGSAASKTIFIDDVSLVQLGEVAAYTPQSIAGGDGYKWRDTTSNENHGAVGGATMVGTHNLGALTAVNGSVGIGTMTPTFATASGSTSVKGLNIQNVGQDTQASLRLTGHNNTGTPGAATYTELRHRGGDLQFDIVHNGTNAINIDASANIKVNGKLGVGGDPDGNHHLLIANAANYGILLTGSNATIQSNSNLILPATNNIYLRPSANYEVIIDSGDGLAITSGDCGIGTASPGAKLDIQHDAASNAITNTAFNIYTRRGSSTPVGFGGKINLQLRNNASDLPVDAAYLSWAVTKAANGDLQPKLVLGTGNAGSTADRLSILYEGTQDHHANRIVNSQTVSDLHRTAEPSLRFDGVNDTVTIATTPWETTLATKVSIAVWFKRTVDTGQAYLIDGDGDELSIQIQADDTLLASYYGTSGIVNATSTKTISNNVWQHVVATYDIGSTIKIYLDGVEVASNSVAGTFYNTLTNFFLGARAGLTYHFNGEIRDFRIHNRALEDTEVAAAYNGESTSFIYEDANSANLSASATFTTAASGGYHIESLTNVTSTGFTWDNTSSSGRVTSGANAFVFEAGKKYRLTAKINKTSGTGNQEVYVRETWDGGTVAADISTANGNNVLQTIDFIAPADTTLGVHFSTPNVAAGTVSDISVVRVGEVAAYTPQSIGGGNTGSWFDTTSNRNHGAVSGATEVNPLKLGPMEIGGDHPDKVNLRYDAADSVPLQIENRNKTTGDTTLIRWKQEDGNSASGYYPVELGTEIANADSRKADFKIFVSDYDNVDRSNDCRLHISNAGDVKATSGTSTNLKQVARVSHHSFTVGTTAAANGATKTIWNIAHNLGINGVVVSVRESSGALGTRTLVETLVHTGEYWDGGSTPPAWGAHINYVAIEFASSPADSTVYDVTVTG